MSLTIAQPKLMLGEGVDEVRFFNALLAKIGISDIQVVEYGGKTRLNRFLQFLPTTIGFSVVRKMLVTRDADDDFAGAFSSVCNGLQTAGLPVPPAAGAVAGANPGVLVYILPDNGSKGMLEDLCFRSVQADPATPCVDDYFQCVQRSSGRNPTPLAKARVHAWLASQIEPDRRLGEAAERGYWPWADAAFQPLIQLLQSL